MDIISRKDIYPVFQPIVSLRSGDVYGYEAFTRMKNDVFPGTISELFKKAEEEGCAWKLDKLCRKAAVKTARNLGLKRALFINATPESVERDFRKGLTRKQPRPHSKGAHTVVLEISGGFPSKSAYTPTDIAEHYRARTYRIAIDGIGTARSGLLHVCETNPEFIKIDRDIIHGIENNPVKRELVKCLAELCEGIGSRLIAKGVETRPELDTLLAMGVCLAQGYYLGKPGRTLAETEPEAYSRIRIFRKNAGFATDGKRSASKKKKEKMKRGAEKSKRTRHHGRAPFDADDETENRPADDPCVRGGGFRECV